VLKVFKIKPWRMETCCTRNKDDASATAEGSAPEPEPVYVKKSYTY
jgi:hypothetical protein